jgi:hypothetical protein
MDQIHPISRFSGVAVYCHNTNTGPSSVQPSAPDDTDNDTEGNLELDGAGTSGALPTVNINNLVTASGANEVLIIHAISSTATAINSFTAAFLLSNNSLSHQFPTLSGSRKRPLSAVSPDETDQSLLFSPAGPLSSTILSPQSSVHTTKHSCHSSSVVEPATSSGRKNTTSIALHAVDSSIRHLGDSLSNNFLDPLRSVQSAVTLLYRVAGLSSEHRRFMTMHLTKDPAVAVVFISLPNDDARLSYIADLYSIQNPSATSSSTVV